MLAALLFSLAWAGGPGAPSTAHAQSKLAGWTLCNETRYVLEAATGRPDAKTILVSGWLRLRPGECRVATTAPLTRGRYYVFARSSSAHRAGLRQWSGAARLCVDPSNSFTIENPPVCEAMGLEERNFREVLVNKRDRWSTSFSEPENFSLPRARAAGLTQLLKDAGIEARKEGGRADPRGMAAAIARFRAQSGLPQNVGEEQLIDALEQVARRRAEAVGLTLCNRTSGRIMTAVARRRGEAWESRGWWPLGPGGCARTIDDPLIQNMYFVKALLETPDGDRVLAAGGESFCSSPAKFAILGREKCEARMYDTSLFTPISPQGREGMVVEFFERDFLAPGALARRMDLPKMADGEVTAPETGRKPRGAPPASAGGPAPKPVAPARTKLPAKPKPDMVAKPAPSEAAPRPAPSASAPATPSPSPSSFSPSAPARGVLPRAGADAQPAAP